MHSASPWVKTRKDVEKIMNRFAGQEKLYSQGAIIYGQDDPADCLYYILEGQVKVFVVHEDGKEKTLSVQESGHFFGETAFFDESRYFASSVAMVDSKLLRLDRAKAAVLLAESPEISMYLLSSLGRKIRLLTFQVECMSFLNVEKRVIALLLSMFELYGECCATGDVLTVQITDQELGNMLGIRREAVTKVLNKLKAMDLLYKKKHLLHAPDLSRLRLYMEQPD